MSERIPPRLPHLRLVEPTFAAEPSATVNAALRAYHRAHMQHVGVAIAVTEAQKAAAAAGR